MVHTAKHVDSYKRWMFFNFDEMVPVVTPEESRTPSMTYAEISRYARELD